MPTIVRISATACSATTFYLNLFHHTAHVTICSVADHTATEHIPIATLARASIASPFVGNVYRTRSAPWPLPYIVPVTTPDASIYHLDTQDIASGKYDKEGRMITIIALHDAYAIKGKGQWMCTIHLLLFRRLMPSCGDFFEYCPN
jgi:hypothetical protein